MRVIKNIPLIILRAWGILDGGDIAAMSTEKMLKDESIYKMLSFVFNRLGMTPSARLKSSCTKNTLFTIRSILCCWYLIIWIFIFHLDYFYFSKSHQFIYSVFYYWEKCFFPLQDVFFERRVYSFYTIGFISNRMCFIE